MNETIKGVFIVFFCSALPFVNFLNSTKGQFESIHSVFVYALAYVIVFIAVIYALKYCFSKSRTTYLSTLSLPSIACIVGSFSFAFMTYHVSAAILGYFATERIFYQHIERFGRLL